jgi:hypothetical protein
MTTLLSSASCLRAANVLLRDHFGVQPGESVVLTADDRSDGELVRALADTAAAIGARPCVLSIPQLPFQGSLSDPYISLSVEAAVKESDVWLDLTFPYMAGSGAFDRAMEHKRSRYLLIGDTSAMGFARLYASVEFDALFDLQLAADGFFREVEGTRCRVTSKAGTDFSFVMGRPATRKERRATNPGAQTIPGSAIFYPELDTVQGTIVLDAVFHEYYTALRDPLVLEVDGRIRSVSGGSAATAMDRALRRAGRGEYGNVIHVTVGLNPGAVHSGRSFMEDIRVIGCNAIGLGLPWWLPGGGENHPDGVVMNQTLQVGDRTIVSDGMPTPDAPFHDAFRRVVS